MGGANTSVKSSSMPKGNSATSVLGEDEGESSGGKGVVSGTLSVVTFEYRKKPRDEDESLTMCRMHAIRRSDVEGNCGVWNAVK